MNLGYLQRGGTPTAYDRLLGTRFGLAAAELALEGATGMMVALQGNRIVPIPLEEVAREARGIDPALLEESAWFFA